MAYARLDAMRGDANAMLEGVLDLGRGGTFQSWTERDVIVRTSLARLEQLDIGDQALTFGRIDRMLEGAGPTGRAPPPPTRTSSRRSTSAGWPSHSADHDPLVVDWRAPIAEPFYRATGRDPQGLVLRRHLALEGRRSWASRTSGSPARGRSADAGVTTEEADGVEGRRRGEN